MTSTLFSWGGTSLWTTLQVSLDPILSTDYYPVGFCHYYFRTTWCPRTWNMAQYPYLGPYPYNSPSKFHSIAHWEKKGGFQFPNDYPHHSYVISFCVGVFSTTKRYALDALAFGALQHLFPAAPCSPCSMMWWRSYGGKFYWGLGGNCLTYFSFSYIYIYCSKILVVPLFASSTLKN